MEGPWYPYRGHITLIKGSRQSDEAKHKISLANSGRICSEETKHKMRLSQSGKKMSDEAKEKCRVSKLGDKNPMYGKTHSAEHNRKFKLAMSGEKHFAWKGDNVGYRTLHHYIRNHLPQPKECQNCGLQKKLDAACVTGIYVKDFSNWKYLCRKCHVRYDVKNRGAQI